MVTLLVLLLWYFDVDLRKAMTKGSWVITLVLDAIIVYGIVEVSNSLRESIGGILLGIGI